MAKMTFNANLLPDNTGSQKELGSSTALWKIYAESIIVGTANYGNILPATGTSGQIFFQEDDGVSVSSYDVTVWNNKSTVSFTPTLTSGTKLGTITINGTDTDLYCNNDVKVTQTKNSGNYNFRLLLSPYTTGHSWNSVTDITYMNDLIYANPSTGVITAGGFSTTGTVTLSAINDGTSIGTNGQVLTSNGTSSYWATPVINDNVDINFDSSSREIIKTVNSITSTVVTMPLVPGTGTGSALGGGIGADSCTASGNYTFAYGKNAVASGNYARAYGAAQALGAYSLAMGPSTVIAYGPMSIAGGLNCQSGSATNVNAGSYSLAYGMNNQSLGQSSMALGSNNIAYGNSSLVFGKYSTDDTTGIYALRIGNGSYDGTTTTRSNALAVDWDGNTIITGNMTIGADFTTSTMAVSLVYDSTLQALNFVFA